MEQNNQYEETTLEDVRKQIDNLNIALESLKKDCDLCVGTESITGFLKDVGTYFWRSLTDISKAFVNFCTAPFSAPLLPELKEYEKVKGKVQRVSNNKEVWDILVKANVQVPYINGCNLPLIEIARTLDSLNKDSYNIVNKALNEINYILSQGLSSPEFRKSKRPYDVKDTFKVAEKYTNEVIKGNEYLIQSDLHLDHQIFGNILYYPNELIEVEKVLVNIKKNLDQKRLDQINSTCKSIGVIASELAKLIDDDRFNKDKDEYPSKEFIKLVNETLTSAGKAVTALSTQFYLTTQFVRVYNFLNKNIDKIVDEAKKDMQNN